MMQLLPRPSILRCWRALLCAAAWLPAAAGAVELGEVVVHSHIGQQLSADIELVDLTADELADLQARLARPDVFKGASISMHPALSGLNIAVVKRDKRRVLHLSTQRPIDGELLHIFFEFSGGGRQTVRTASLWLTPDPAPVRSAAGPADGGSGRPALAGNAVMAELSSRSGAPEAPAAKPPTPKAPTVAAQTGAQEAVSVTPVSAAAKLSSTPPKSAASAADASAGTAPSDAELSAALARATARRAAHAMPASAPASAPAAGKGKRLRQLRWPCPPAWPPSSVARRGRAVVLAGPARPAPQTMPGPGCAEQRDQQQAQRSGRQGESLADCLGACRSGRGGARCCDGESGICRAGRAGGSRRQGCTRRSHRQCCAWRLGILRRSRCQGRAVGIGCGLCRKRGAREPCCLCCRES
ncbi:hypothetical protein MJ904_13700 [Massilia sp. MB5]|uniref:type IV pilus assembly protein FimV n=1 Tax=Massilia sp. MB5 TaxID=2919578 RepID=UPI001F0E2434|nr:hypothetical protein [Massilia sp. MB5]UMR33121.1 hypothetical protein MJ904_13700 [Massilia sp. MB5]